MITHSTNDVCLVSMFFAPNYGSILVAYACHTLVKSLGYSVLTLQKPSYVWSDRSYSDKIAQGFARKYYNVSSIPKTPEELMELNSSCNQFVVASDQIFHPLLHLDYSFLDWVNNEKNKIAFGASFGHDRFQASQRSILYRQYLLDRFNHIALREKSETLCDKIFKIDAVEIIDPTLILPSREFDNLVESVDMEIEEPYLLTYNLDITKEKFDAIKYISSKLKLKTVSIAYPEQQDKTRPDFLEINKDFAPEEFLYLYKHASFVVTDSFHGTCFAVKYNKPFVSFENSGRGALRYKLFNVINASDHIISDVSKVYTKPNLLDDIDYTETNKIIREKADFAIKWLSHALKTNNSKEKFSHFENYSDVKLKGLETKCHNTANKLRGELESENKSLRNELESEIESLRNELESEIESSRNESESENKSLRNELESEIESLRNESESENKSLRNESEFENKSLRNELESENRSLRNKLEAENKSLRNKLESENRSLRNKLEAEIESLRNESESENKSLRNELKSEIELLQNRLQSDVKSIRVQMISQQAEWTRLRGMELAHARELAQISSILREIVSFPLTWLNLQRCRLASHLLIGRTRQHYAMKKRRLRARIRRISNFYC